MPHKYSWISTYKGIIEYLRNKKDSQKELIELLKSVGITPFNDKSKAGDIRDIELNEIDPFTFLSYINKYGSKRRVKKLQAIAEKLNLHIPNDDLGLPTSQPQSVWLFPPQYLRTNNEIDRLWRFFYKLLDNNITNEDFEDILGIRNIANRKLTEAMFYVDPERYLPINGPTIPYIEQELGINSDFKTYDDYLYLLNNIKSKIDIPFYQLSHEAWEWKRQKRDDENILRVINQFKLQLKDGVAIKYERYKWELIQKYHRRPNLNADNFTKEMVEIDYDNMIHYMSKSTIRELAKEKPKEYRDNLKILFDESKPLNDRVKSFKTEIDKLYKQIHPNKKSNHDERTISALLTYHNPEKYTFYKYSYYKEFCKLMNVKQEDTLKNYSHYLELLKEFIDTYINEDVELLELMSEQLGDDCYEDPNNLLLAQNILYETFDGWISTPNYWIFQGNPKVFDFETAMQNNTITDWTASAHNERIKPGDKVIIWLVGNKAGCYALADVTKAPRFIDNSTDDSNWKTEHPAKDNLKVGIKITHDLIENPILKEETDQVEELENLKVGNQGTNFLATEKEYEKILEMAKEKQNSKERQFWLFTPGVKATMWDEFYTSGIMGLGWDEIGDVQQYNNQKEIVKKLNEIKEMNALQTNDSLANYEFLNKIRIGDIIISKRGTTEYLGYGIVTSDYYYDESRASYKKCRKVDWRQKGVWYDKDIVAKTLTNITSYPEYINKLIALLNIQYEKTPEIKMSHHSHPLNQILYGPPGTGKTYITKQLAVEIINGEKNRERDEINKEYAELVSNGQIVFTTFHQSLSYEDFIEGIKPETIDGLINYEIKDGIFKKFCLSANPKNTINFESSYKQLLDMLSKEELITMKTPSNLSSFSISLNRNGNLNLLTGNDQKHNGVLTKERLLQRLADEDSVKYWQGYYDGVIKFMIENLNFDPNPINESKQFVIIIDEINRGNIPAIFGELITLLEEDKRKGNNEELEVTLPYSNDKFSIPNNVYIIGTMNTADRSVEALDTALRRRFSFTEMPSQPSIIATAGKLKDGVLDNISLPELLTTINLRIEKLLDRDHHIGHSYFMHVESIEDLKCTFQHKIVPLLQEYFFGDYGKIGLILGEGFFEDFEEATNSIFATFNDYSESDYSERPIYRLRNAETMNDQEFHNAINILLNKGE